jgi:hypothetical protein
MYDEVVELVRKYGLRLYRITSAIEEDEINE